MTRIDPDGQQTLLGGLGGEPNGLAMADDGSIFLANIGTGTIQKLHPDGHSEEFLTEVDGIKRLVPTTSSTTHYTCSSCS